MLSRLKDKIKTESVDIKSSGTEIWEKFYPKFEGVIVNGFLDVAEDKLTNEEDLKLVIHKVYELLPTLVRLTLSRDFFTDKVFVHKEKILDKVISTKQKRLLLKEEQLLIGENINESNEK